MHAYIELGRPLAVPLAAALAGLLVAETVLFVVVIEQGPTTHLGMDYLFYRDLGARWLADGQWYLPSQFEVHELAPMAHNVYPPSAIYLFAPAALAPWFLWWAIPIAVLGYALWRIRPAPWAWPLLVVLMMWPRSIGGYLYGNTTMWTAAGLAAGLIWGWPIIVLAIKTAAWPWGLLVVRRHETWIALAVFALASIPMIPLWIDYVTVIRNQMSPVTVAALLGDIPPMLIPVVAWWAATSRRSASPSASSQALGI